MQSVDIQVTGFQNQNRVDAKPYSPRIAHESMRALIIAHQGGRLGEAPVGIKSGPS